MDVEWRSQNLPSNNRLGRLISAWSEPYHWETRRLLLLAGRKLFTSNSPLTLQPAFTCLISHCSRSQKRNVLFILIASPLLYVPPLFFRLDLPQRLQGCFALLCVTICCCCWDGHVILLLTVVRTGAFAAQDAGAQQLLPLIWRADVSVGLIISWETDLLASYILQGVVSYRPQNEKKKKVQFWGFTMEERMYLNSCYSCISAEYWLLLWDNRRVVQRTESTRYEWKSPRRSGWRPALWCDEIPEIGDECSCEIKSDESFLRLIVAEKTDCKKIRVCTHLHSSMRSAIRVPVEKCHLSKKP